MPRGYVINVQRSSSKNMEWRMSRESVEVLELIREMREERTKQLKDKMLDFMKGVQNETTK